jgi:predicted  nucleic acid-binding Zn-ribbon protein
MAQVEQLLKYQEEDSKLLKIEQETANSEERKKYVQTKNFLTKASEKLDQLEGKSQEIIALLERLTKKYEEIVETLKDFEHLDELVEEGANISFYQKNALQITENLKALKAEIAQLTAAAKEAGDEYQSIKKKVIAAQKQFPEFQAAYQEYKKSRQAETEAVTQELEKIAKGIDPDVLKKYQAKRSERIFPILCQVNGDRCSKCGMELSIAGKEIIASGKVIECENCHRFLYSDK